MNLDIGSPDHWLASLAALLIVIGFLMIAAAVQEWRQWRKGG